MAFKLKWTNRVKKSLKNLERPTIIKIIQKVEAAKENPYFYLKRLVKQDVWRLRAGDYRVLIDLDNKNEILYILEIGHRKKIYKHYG